MKAENQLALFLLFAVCVCATILWASMIGTTKESVAQPLVEPKSKDYTYIGTTENRATLTRINDLEQGVVCYILDGHRALSCVPMRDK